MTTRDIITICGYIISGATLITGTVLTGLGLDQATASKVTIVIGIVVGVATLIQNRLLNPSPPPGMVSANIPVGTIPQVTPQKGPPTT
jgi:hypothetical protein